LVPIPQPHKEETHARRPNLSACRRLAEVSIVIAEVSSTVLSATCVQARANDRNRVP
jgi:hypothetical protein